jgi:hypothetical protein
MAGNRGSLRIGGFHSMTQQEHLKRVLSDIRAKEQVARMKSVEEDIKARAFYEAATVVEVELTRFPVASTPDNQP